MLPERRIKKIKGFQPTYIAVLNDALDYTYKLMIASGENPFAAYNYARALKGLILMMPPQVKEELEEALGVDVDAVVQEALNSCKPEPNRHPYNNAVECLNNLIDDLDKLFRVVVDIAHKHGLFLLEREVVYGRE